MNNNQNSGPDIGLSFTRRMGLSWEHSDSDPGNIEAEADHMRNERLFQLILLYDEYPKERRDVASEQTSDLERMEAKLDAVIHLLAFLIAESESGAGERLVNLAAHHLEWEEGRLTSPAAGDRLCILLEIDPRLPRALKMAARVTQLTPIDADCVRVRVALEDQGERVQDALEKLIFRIHRREIARKRSDTGA